ncbi:nucleotidyl cyclase domain-containing protein [Amycolatopsis jiangsuensis]|uniref:Class 3 adenylate cyclase n=1 Tax=Amycolatopsis jiangsuensis TaxID=1181879 RepID=A0A840ITC2_9PSEU|nr:hypothetical protein [Amycolatopsis jiangsuensis]MBB4684617.1 class 3 adenylate cyclase [Amycolatopsis jiangsuensis]
MNTAVLHLPVLHVPLHRAILVADVEGSTTRTNPGRAQLRAMLFDLLDGAFRACGITEEARDSFLDRGDGALCLVRPVDEAPKTVLLAGVVPELAVRLARHNATHPDEAFRLRVAVHAGEVHYDLHGPYGEAVDLACRLLDAPEVRKALRGAAGPVALTVSEGIYSAVVVHGYAGIDRSAFGHAFHVRVGRKRVRGWIRTAGWSPAGTVLPDAGLTA